MRWLTALPARALRHAPAHSAEPVASTAPASPVIPFALIDAQ